MFEQFHSRLPFKSALVEYYYGSQHLCSDVILSCCGVQQGDLLAP